jgi:hypothetical protein
LRLAHGNTGGSAVCNTWGERHDGAHRLGDAKSRPDRPDFAHRHGHDWANDAPD